MPEPTPTFDDIQDWVSALVRALEGGVLHCEPIGSLTLPFCLSRAFPEWIEVVEMAPMVCLHAPHPQPHRLSVSTTWSHYARYQGRLFGADGEVPLSHAQAKVHSAAMRWLLPMEPAHYTLQTPMTALSQDIHQRRFASTPQPIEAALIEGLRARAHHHAQAAALEATTVSSPRRIPGGRL